MSRGYYIYLRILHIEDDLAVQKFVQKQLASVMYADVKLFQVNDLASGLIALKNEIWDCILLDLKLPDSEGLETFHHVHGSTEVPIIVLTGDDDLYARIEVVAAGAQDCLYKGDANPDALIRSIRFAVERQRSIIELMYALREVRSANRTLEELLFEFQNSSKKV